MATPKDISFEENTGGKPKSRTLRRTIKFFILTLLFLGILTPAVLLYNNISLSSDKDFTDSLNTAIDKTVTWMVLHKSEVLVRGNVALLKMLQDCDQMQPNPAFSGPIDSFMLRYIRPSCWKALLDPNWPIQKLEFNAAIKQEIIDNKWILYALATEKADVTPEQIGLFDRDRWQGRQLTHQLWAIIHLSERTADNAKLNELIEHLSGRIAKELNCDIAVVDIYIQKVAFVLKAGFPEKIRRRWIERVIKNQQDDGGWNDRWFCFRSRRRPIFNLEPTPSDQHATIQALWLLYQVKYRYPEHFGVKD